MNPATRKKFLIIIASGGVVIALVDQLTMPSVAAGSDVPDGITDDAAASAEVTTLGDALGVMPTHDIVEDRFARLFGVREQRASTSSIRSALTPSDQSTLRLPVLSAVSTADGGIAVLDGRVMRVGEDALGVTLLDVSGRTATIRISGQIEILEVR